MFARRFFPGRFFAPTYFPPVADSTPPVTPPIGGMGFGPGKRKDGPDDDEFLMLFT